MAALSLSTISAGMFFGPLMPVMPVTTVGFKLRADGFFDGNPALELPPQHGQHQDR